MARKMPKFGFYLFKDDEVEEGNAIFFTGTKKGIKYARGEYAEDEELVGWHTLLWNCIPSIEEMEDYEYFPTYELFRKGASRFPNLIKETALDPSKGK